MLEENPFSYYLKKVVSDNNKNRENHSKDYYRES